MDSPRLTFVELDRRIRELPEGPISVLNSPKWVVWLDTVGWFGIILGLLPSILILYMTPAMWMVYVARIGLWMAIVFFLPGRAWQCWVLFSEIRHQRFKSMQQADHDLEQFQILTQWLCTFDNPTLEAHRNFANFAIERVSGKVAFIAGDLNKLGILPALLGVFLLFKNVQQPDLEQLFETPAWLAVLVIGLVIIYFISMIGLRMRNTFQLHERFIADALKRKQAATDDRLRI